MSNIKKTDEPMPQKNEETLDKIINESDYMRGYKACERKYQRGPTDIKVSTADLPEEFTRRVNDWFVNNCPIWGVTLQNNLWHYYLAQHFFNLGKAEANRGLIELKDKAARYSHEKFFEENSEMYEDVVKKALEAVMRFDMMSEVVVTLTAYGAEILNAYHQECRNLIQNNQKTILYGYRTDYKEGETHHDSLWMIFRIFGGQDFCYHGADTPFTELKSWSPDESNSSKATQDFSDN